MCIDFRSSARIMTKPRPLPLLVFSPTIRNRLSGWWDTNQGEGDIKSGCSTGTHTKRVRRHWGKLQEESHKLRIAKLAPAGST